MTSTQKKATAAAVRKIAEMTAKHCKGKRRQEALEHLRRLDGISSEHSGRCASCDQVVHPGALRANDGLCGVCFEEYEDRHAEATA